MGICYCNFHEEKGNEIVCQFPDNIISQTNFEKISNLLLPEQSMCDRVYTMNFNKYYLVSYPNMLSNKNYKRFNLVFCVFIIVKKNSYERDNHIYDSFVRKISKSFENAEIDCGCSFLQKDYEAITQFIREIYDAIKNGNKLISIQNQKRPNLHFFFEIKHMSIAKAKIVHNLTDDDLIQKIPMWIKKYEIKSNLEINKREIIKAIDGAKRITDIIEETKIKLNAIKSVICNLVSEDYVELIDSYNDTNEFALSNKFVGYNQDEIFKMFKEFVLSNGGKLNDTRISVYCLIQEIPQMNINFEKISYDNKLKINFAIKEKFIIKKILFK